MASLSERPEDIFMGVLESEWTPSNVRGYDVNDGSLPLADSIENVGAVYPSLIIQFSSETSGGNTTYDYISSSGPGSNNNGELIATVRAQDDENNTPSYENDGGTAVRADTIAYEIIQEVERITRDNATGADTDFGHLGGQRGPDAPDDLDESPPVRIEQFQVSYSWIE